MTMTHVLYHANCPDGFGAAWIADRNLFDVTLVPMNWGDEIPAGVDGERVFLVDYCLNGDQLVELAARAREVTVLDHHHTSAQYLHDASPDYVVYGSVSEVPSIRRDHCIAVLDQSRSGVGIAMEWFADTEHPWLLRIEDRDLWRWDYAETAEVFAAVTSRPYTIDDWDAIDDLDFLDLVTEGKAITRYRDLLIELACDGAWNIPLPGHGSVFVAPCPYSIGSDVAGRLAQRHPGKVGAYIMVQPNSVRFGLRSTDDGPDVAALAAQFGGGGHVHASGFEISYEEFLSWRY